MFKVRREFEPLPWEQPLINLGEMLANLLGLVVSSQFSFSFLVFNNMLCKYSLDFSMFEGKRSTSQICMVGALSDMKLLLSLGVFINTFWCNSTAVSFDLLVSWKWLNLIIWHTLMVDVVAFVFVLLWEWNYRESRNIVLIFRKKDKIWYLFLNSDLVRIF